MEAAERTTLSDQPGGAQLPAPRFGGILWRIARRTNRLALPLTGSRWNPIFAVVEHRGRHSGRLHRTPVAARHVADGFVISLAFGAHVDWYRNLMAAGGGAIRWRGVSYSIAAPEVISAAVGRAAFHPIQRLFLQFAGIDGYILVRDIGSSPR